MCFVAIMEVLLEVLLAVAVTMRSFVVMLLVVNIER
jgi:hypothetical protein